MDPLTSHQGHDSIWPDSSETRVLMRSADRGDQAAVNELLERHRGSLRRMIELRMDRRVMSRVDASDVVQDVLLEASRRLKDYLRDPPLSFHLWLRQLAQDRMIDVHRRHRGAQKRSVDREQRLAVGGFADRSSLDLAGQLRDGELTPAAETIRRELAARFRDALDDLAEEDREMILMRHYEHLGNREVAEALGISDAAAGMRHLRALRRLRAILGEDQSAG
jgi:RNA polymerase sigma-70 factor (ECF subfamily)